MGHSNVIYKNGQVQLYDKSAGWAEGMYIDYGISILTRPVVESLPAGEAVIWRRF